MSARARRRVVLGSATITLVVLGAGALVLLGEARRTEADLSIARDAAAAAVDAAEDGDLAAATAHLHEARDALAPVVDRQDGPLWSIAGRLPVISASFRTVDAIADTARAGVEVATGIAEAAANLQTSRTASHRVPLAPLSQLGEVARSEAAARLIGARDRLALPVSGPMPASVRRAREEVLETSGALVSMLDPIRDMASVVPALLGAEGPRRYLVAMQNSAELRGTGGLIGFHAVLTANDGELSLTPPRTDEKVDVPPDAVPALSADHRDWLAHLQPTASLKNVNLDPDFTRTAPMMIAVYEAATGAALDGVIAVDPVGLASLMRPGEELQVPEAVADPDAGVPARLAARDLPRAMLVDAYQVLGGSTDRRKAFHAALAEAAFDQLLELTWDEGLLDRLGFAIEGRHLQVHSRDPATQAALERLGAAGRMTPAQVGDDLLAVTANNAGAGKPDVHVRHEVSTQIVLSPQATLPADGASPSPVGSVVPARRDVTMGLALDNPLAPDEGWADYIVRTSLPDRGHVPALRATNRTWLTMWAPAGTRVVGGRSEGQAAASVGSVGGLTRVDHLLTTPPRSTRTAEIGLTGPVELRSVGEGLAYRLTLWHQAKGISDHVRVLVSAADGWEVVSGRVNGRSDADRLGFDEVAEPLRLVVEDGTASVHGTAVGDVEVEVVLRPSG